MRVLMIAPDDVGGCLAHLAHALRGAGVGQARLVTGSRDPVAGFAEDIVEPLDGGAEARDLLDGATALHLVDLDPETAALFGAPLGQAARRVRGGVLQIERAPRAAWLRLREVADGLGWTLVTTRADVAAATGARLMAPFVPLWRGPWRPLADGTRSRESVRRPVVVFASARVPLHLRPRLEALVDEADALVGRGQQLETVVRRPQRHVLRKRRYAHVCLCEGAAALPLSAFEALAQGLTVVSDTSVAALEDYAVLAGSRPPVRPLDDLGPILDGMRAREPADPAMRAWAERAMDPRRWLALVAEAYAARRSAA